MIYHLVRELVRLTAHIFYRHIEVVGSEHIPTQGAIIFFGNHPNSLLDPALITAFGERKIHFMAKDTLFSNPLMNTLLKQMGAVPIRRRKDQAEGKLDNHDAFEALYEVLTQGGAMGIFPEGISHNGTQLSELKTGAARIALAMKERGINVQLVPCGLTYLRRDHFRSAVLIQFGDALSVEDLYRQGKETARALTDQMEMHLRALTVNAETWEDLSLLDTVRRLYQPPKITVEQRVELARRFNTHYPKIKEKQEVKLLADEVKNYQESLYLLGLQDRDISGSLSALTLFGRSIRHFIFTLFWFPLALLGSPIHFPLAYILGRGSRLMAPRKDVIATTKFIAGFLMLNALYLGLGLWAWQLGYGTWSFAVPIVFAFSGFGCLKLAERGRSLWRTIWIWTHCISAKHTIKELRATRRKLHQEILVTVNEHLPQDIERLFYQDTNQD